MESHRSTFIPAVEYDVDGTVIVSERNGSYPVRLRSSNSHKSARSELEELDDVIAEEDDDDIVSNARDLEAEWSQPPINDSIESSLDQRGFHLRRNPGIVRLEVPSSPLSENGSGSITRTYKRRIPPSDTATTMSNNSSSIVTGGGGGTMSTASSSLLRRLRVHQLRRQQRHGHAAKGQGHSIDRRRTLKDVNDNDSVFDDDNGAPSNPYFRELVAAKRRQAAEEHRRSTRSKRGSRRRDKGSKQRTESRFSSKPTMNSSMSDDRTTNGSSRTGNTESSVGGHSSLREILNSDRSYSDDVCCECSCCCCSCCVEAASKCRRRTCDVVMTILFVLVGCLLVAVGVIRVLVCYWHEFGCAIWAGVLLTLFGVLRVCHLRDGDNSIKTVTLMVVGAVASAVVLVAVAFSLVVLVPALGQVVNYNNTNASSSVRLDSLVLATVNFSKYSSLRTVTGVQSVTSPSVALDLIALCLLALSLHCQTLTVQTLDDFWLPFDLNRGRKPSILFNPSHQASLGQITVFVGLVEIAFMDYLADHDDSAPHVWCMVWSGALLIVSGMASLCYGKRADSKLIGIVSTVLQVCSVLASATTTVLTTLSLAKDADRLRLASTSASGSSSRSVSNLGALVAAQALSDCLAVIGVIFVVGTLFRHMTRLCCCSSRRDDDVAPRNSDQISLDRIRQRSASVLSNGDARRTVNQRPAAARQKISTFSG